MQEEITGGQGVGRLLEDTKEWNLIEGKTASEGWVHGTRARRKHR